MVRMLAPRLPLARTAIVRLPPRKADPYYLTPEWRELRRQTLFRFAHKRFIMPRGFEER